jgi:hypothetical protein
MRRRRSSSTTTKRRYVLFCCFVLLQLNERTGMLILYPPPHASSVPQVTRCVSSPSPPPVCSPALPASLLHRFVQAGRAVQGPAVQNNGRPWCCSSVIRCVFSPSPPPVCLPALPALSPSQVPFVQAAVSAGGAG